MSFLLRLRRRFKKHKTKSLDKWPRNETDDPPNAQRIPSGTTSIALGGESTSTVGLREPVSRLLRGVKMVQSHTTQCLEGTRTRTLADVGIPRNELDDPSNVRWIPSGTTTIVVGGESTSTVDLQELESRLLRGVKTVKPYATQCLEGTRTSILANVNIMTNDRNGANVIHIYGAPGSGKSSISLTAKSQLHHQRRLVTYFRFDRNEAATTTPTALWCRVTYDLARLFPSVLSRLLQQLRNNEVDLDSPMDIFTTFVEGSLSSITSPVDRTFVIIIDALDECGGLVGQQSPDRQMLLKTLQRWAKLPKCFKLLVTSRPEGDITRVLSSISIPIEIPSGHSVTENPQAKWSIESSNDIRMFLEECFQLIRQSSSSLPADWPGSVIVSGMVRRAAGIFMWATTAASFIDSGIDPRGRLRKIMDDVSDPSSMQPLYSLYAIVLEMAFGKIGSGGVEAEILRFVLGTMVLAKRPLNEIEYTKLPTTEPITGDMLGSIRDRLRSVISPGSLRFVHKSFDDFLLSDECPPKYRISQDDTHYLLTKLCLKTMTDGLRFNICNLETSCVKNVDAADIATKVANGIPPLLSYSCLFFADHLGLTPFDEHLMRQVQEMMLDKLLFWFESMSLLKEINRVSPSLLLILRWLHISPIDEFKDFLHDAHRFIRAFGYPIAQSAPHIYISALPFAPENSSVAKHFLPQFPWILSVSTGKSTDWPACIFTLEHHRGSVNCVAFSADEKYFASGSDDKTICIFDSETGNLISGPFECDDEVSSVCFDPNGRQVGASSNDGKVICWDIETGNDRLVICTSDKYIFPERFHCRFNGSQIIISAGKTIALWNGETGRCEQNYDSEHMVYAENTLTSISPDGCYVARVTGQHGTTIRLGKVLSGSKIQSPVDLHPQFKHPQPISVLSFSVDSKFAVSGSVDGTILIWDVCTGDNVGPPFITETGEVSAVAYSPKNHLLASTSAMVMVWNATTRELVGRLEGHTSFVLDIALSRDGQRVLTASVDKTVRMWDLGRKGSVLAADANQAHTSAVKAVAFSPCGKRLASLNKTSIRGWDTNTGKLLFKCQTGIDYDRLIFSPDGSQVMAYCDKRDRGSVAVWNTSTGALVSKINCSDDGKKDTQITQVAFRTTDQVLVLCSNNGVVRTWSVGKGLPQIIAKVPNVFALSPDGLTAIVHDYLRSPSHYVWSTTTHQPLPFVFAAEKYVSSFPRAYSPSGQFFSSSNDSDQGGSTLRVWNMRTGGLPACFLTTARVCSLAFSPDDRFIAIAYYTPSQSSKIQIFDACTGQPISGPWSGRADRIITLTFSPDVETLVSGSRDGHVRVWNVVHILETSQGLLSNSGVPTHIEDGWVKELDGKPLFWVPKDHRARLVWPDSRVLGDSETTTELDLSRFRYRENWTECFAGEILVVKP